MDSGTEHTSFGLFGSTSTGGKSGASEASCAVDEEDSDDKAIIASLTRRMNLLINENQCLKGSKGDQSESFFSETIHLKETLSRTASLCQDLAQTLQTEKRRQCKTGNTDQEVVQLKKTVSDLKAQLKEVVDTNMKWQLYNEQRENYVKGLHQSIAELEDKCSQLSKCQSGQASFSEAQQKEIDNILLSAKGRVAKLEEEKDKIQDELRNAKRLHHEKEQQCLRLEDKVKDLEARVPNRPSGIDSDPHLIPLLQEQIRAVTEDFEAERKDREKAQNRIAELESELQVTRIQLQQFQSTRMQDLYERRQEALRNYSHGLGYTNCAMQYRQQSRRPLYHAGYNYVDVAADGVEGLDEVDGPQHLTDKDKDQDDDDDVDDYHDRQTQRGEDVADGVDASYQSTSMINSGGLQCERCWQEFPRGEEMQFQQHQEACLQG